MSAMSYLRLSHRGSAAGRLLGQRSARQITNEFRLRGLRPRRRTSAREALGPRGALGLEGAIVVPIRLDRAPTSEL